MALQRQVMQKKVEMLNEKAAEAKANRTVSKDTSVAGIMKDAQQKMEDARARAAEMRTRGQKVRDAVNPTSDTPAVSPEIMTREYADAFTKLNKTLSSQTPAQTTMTAPQLSFQPKQPSFYGAQQTGTASYGASLASGTAGRFGRTQQGATSVIRPWGYGRIGWGYGQI